MARVSQVIQDDIEEDDDDDEACSCEDCVGTPLSLCFVKDSTTIRVLRNESVYDAVEAETKALFSGNYARVIRINPGGSVFECLDTTPAPTPPIPSYSYFCVDDGRGNTDTYTYTDESRRV